MNLSNLEAAAIVIIAIMLGGFVNQVVITLYKRWTTDYLPRKDFEEYKKYVRETFQRKDHHEEDFKKLLVDMEEIKRVLAIIAIKLKVDISKAHLTVSLDDLKEVLKNEKKNNNKD